MTNITPEEYENRLAKFLVENGPNRGSGFFGQWAWRAMKERFFSGAAPGRGVSICPADDTEIEIGREPD
jgi:hypothetical protein